MGSPIEPRKSSDKFNKQENLDAAMAGTPEKLTFDYTKAEPGENVAEAAVAAAIKKTEPEYKTINSPMSYLVTGIAVFLAAVIGGIHSVWSFIPLIILGLIVFNISKAFFKPKKYKVPVEHKLTMTGFAETDEILKKADESLKNIRKASETIADKDAEYADTLDELVEDAYRIVDFTAENVAQVTQLRRFYNYYLPTLEKLSKTYVALEKGGEGERVSQTKEEIVTATEAMKSLFEKQFDKMYQNTALDISTDVDVLESMLESDGIKATMGGH